VNYYQKQTNTFLHINTGALQLLQYVQHDTNTSSHGIDTITLMSCNL